MIQIVNVRIGLVVYNNGAKRYMLMPEGLMLVVKVIASKDAEAKSWKFFTIKKYSGRFYCS